MVYEARPINYIIELWEGSLAEQLQAKARIEANIATLAQCIDGLKRNLKETPRPLTAEELAEAEKD